MSMYLEHFGLRESPFRITPHTEFFYSGGNRGATLDALVYAITHDEGIVKVTGEVGSGKTMLCRMLLEKLPATVETIYLANPSMTRDEILFALADELHVSEPPARVHLLLRTIQQRLVDLYANGKQVVMLIDEAHAMPPDSLEEIRLLSNLESNRHKLLQIVLFGQPELNELLARNEMRQLRERITHNFSLDPLHRQDIGSYIAFRMRAAGYHGPDLFSPAAIQLISESSIGLTRRVNILADKALLATFSESLYLVDTAQAKAAIADAQFGPMPGGENPTDGRRKRLLAVAVTALAFAAATAWYFIGTDKPAATNADSIKSALATPPESPPRGDRPASTASSNTGTMAAVAVPPPAAAESTPPARSLPPNPGTVDAATAAALAALQTVPREPARGASDWLTRGQESFGRWLPKASSSHYFIQILRTGGERVREVEDIIARIAAGADVDPEQIRVYRSSVNGQDWISVIYGDYPSRDAATSAIRALPAAARSDRPYPRSVQILR